MPQKRLYPEPIESVVRDEDDLMGDDQDIYPDTDYPTVVVDDYPANSNYIVA